MNVLRFDQQVTVISALAEGCSIRSVERLTGIHRDTIMRLAARVGFGAIKFHARTVHRLQVPRLIDSTLLSESAQCGCTLWIMGLN